MTVIDWVASNGIVTMFIGVDGSSRSIINLVSLDSNPEGLLTSSPKLDLNL